MRPIIILILLAGPMSPAARGQAGETTSDAKPATKTHPAQSDVLSLIPADVELAISVPSLAALDVQAAGLLKRLGRAGSSGALEPVLDWLEIVEGVDRSRSAAIAIWPANMRIPANVDGTAPPGGSRKMALFIPTDSLESLVRFHSPSPTGSGILRVTIRGRSAWVTETAGHAIFATSEDTLRAIQQSEHALRDRLTPAELKNWTASDMVVFGNSSTGQPGATLLSLIPHATPWLAPAAELLQRASQWSCALQLKDNGVALDVVAAISPPRRNPSAIAADDIGLLGIPREPIACAFGARNAYSIDLHVIPLVNLIASSQAFAANNDTRKSGLPDAVRALLGKLDGFSFSVSGAALATGPPINLAATAKLRAKPARMQGAIEELVAVLHEGPFANARTNRMMSHLALKPAVETAAGVTIDHLVLNTDSFEGLNRRAIMDAFGTDGVTMRLAIVDERYLVTTLGGGLDRFLAVANALRSGRSPIEANARLIRAAEHIKKDGFLEAYVSPSQLSSLRQTISRLIENVTGQPTKERATELVGLSAGVNPDNAYRIDLFLPDDILAGLLSAPAQHTARKSRR